jgi:chemotaxis protein histidine kinase CheA
MENPYAPLVLEEVLRSCTLLAVDFANIQAIQASNENEKIKKCMQWQETLQQIDCALHFIEIEDLSAIIKIQKQVIGAVAKSDLASSTQLFTLLSKTQHATSLLLEKQTHGWPIFPISLFTAYKSLNQALFQDEVSAAYLIHLPHENDLPTALQTLSQAEITGITLQELIEMYESALLMLLKHESEATVKAAAEKLAKLFSYIARRQKEKNIYNVHAASNREQLYSQVFQLYAQKIADGENFNFVLARKIFSAMRRKIYQLTGDAKQTFRCELLQEVLFELGLNAQNDVSVTELLQCFDIQQQVDLLAQSQSSWDELDARSDAWDDFFHAVEQTKNTVLANYSFEQSAVLTNPQLSYLHDAFENMMKLASAICEPLQNSLRNYLAVLDSSSVSEQGFNQLLAYLLLLEQIALNKQEWEFSQAGQSKLSIILSDIEIDLSPSKTLFKLGSKSQYLEKRQAHHALLSGLQHGLVFLENKLDSVLIVGQIDNEEKIIRNVLTEIILVLKFLNAEKLIHDFSSLKDSVIQYIEQASADLTFADTIVEKFLLFEKELSYFFLHEKNNDELIEPIFNSIENTIGVDEIKLEENDHEVNQLEVNQLEINQVEKQLNIEELHHHQKPEQSFPISSHSLSLAPLPLIASPALQRIYLKEAQQLVAQLNNALQTWLLSPDEHVLQTAAHAAHSLAGSSATVGVPSMSALSTALEQVLQLVTDAAHTDQITVDLLMQSATALTSQLQDLSSGVIPDAKLALVEQLQNLRDRLSGDLVASGVTLLNVSTNDVNPATHPTSEWIPHSSVAASEAVVLEEEEEESSSPHSKLDSIVESIEDKFGHEIEEDPDAELVAIFIEEATDYFPELDALLRNWFDHPQNTDSANAVLRILHTLKGGARMAGCKALGQHFHQMETEIEQLADAPNRDGEKIAQLFLAYDFAASALAKLKNQSQNGDDELHEPLLNHQDGQQDNQREGKQDTSLITASAAHEKVAATQESTLLRVRTDVMDRLAGSAAELIVDGARLSAEIQQQKKFLLDLTDALIRLRSQLRELEFVAESSIASKMQASQQQAFDPLEFDRFTRLQELTRSMAESMSDAASIERSLSRQIEKTHTILYSHEKYARAIQNDLKRVRVVRFASVSERLHHLVRQVARESEREVRLDITGSQSEIDRSLLDKIISPIEHLLRNAITHGIEASANRIKAGKDKCGKLIINLIQQGNEIIITISDDGRGLDFARIAERAKTMGLLAMDANPSEESLTETIFAPGFSTSSELTANAGRGIGMNVVRDTVLSQRGVIQVKSQTGQGVTFTLFLPLSLATAAVVIIQHSDRQFALPSNMVEQVLQLSLADLKLARQSGEILWRKERIELQQLALLFDEDGATETELRTALNSVIILRGVHGQLALEVQAILGNGEVVVRNIGPQVSTVKGIVGASVMPDGSIALIINPLLFLVSDSLRKNKKPASVTTSTPIFKVLVVDDSLTVRRISQRLLERAGYSVLLARDGLHAIEILQTEQVSIVLLDIEMPRMDGFEFLHYLRQDTKTSTLPVVMITSRTADKHRAHAKELGATAYLGKPFNETELLTLIKSFA